MEKRHFVVLVPSDSEGIKKTPLKEWLRQHPENIPARLDPDRSNSWALRDGLKKRGWTVTETSTEVQLAMPSATHSKPMVASSDRATVAPRKMDEDAFANLLVTAMAASLQPHRVARRRSLLYELCFDNHGVLSMGVDPDTGEPIRGGGRGFEQDILVFDDAIGGHTSVVPLIVAEVKFRGVTTHDVIVYSEKADRIRRVYPYLRYGFVLGGMPRIPGRVLRLGQRFDFIAVMSEDPRPEELAEFGKLMREEADASMMLQDLLYGNRTARLVRKRLIAE